MSDWLREVEHASYNLQYTGPDSTESNPLIDGTTEEGPKCTKYIWVLFLGLLLAAGTGVGFYLLFQEEPEWPVNVPYVVVPRHAWRAQQPVSDISAYSDLPLSHVQIRQTDTDKCDKPKECSKLIRGIQNDHVAARNLSDIAYNFIVAGDGRSYEGRGWKLQPGLSDEQERETTLVIAFLGNFQDIQPSRAQVQQVKVLIQEAVKRNVLNKCFTISLYKQNPQDGAGQLTRVFMKLSAEINKRKQIFKCT